MLAKIASDNDQDGLYILTPDGTQSVVTGFEDITYPQEQLDNFLFLLSISSNIAPAGIFNTETDEFSLLNGRIAGLLRDSCCVFSEDGTHMRYISTETPEDDLDITWTLHDRDLLSGEDRVVMTLDEFQGKSAFYLSIR
ncbi:MAG: hypothetical protein H6672_21970 [Anaerolineaceae bacterium]|nr:hypothetical protein [Anaerolineaceae bacterium]